MEIIRIKAIEELNSLRMEGIQKILDDTFAEKAMPRKFSWANFLNYWEFALLLPGNVLWLLVDEIDEDTVYGILGGICTPDILTDYKIAVANCWTVSKEARGKGFGWELLATFMEWAMKEQGATRIFVQRTAYKDPELDKYLDAQLKRLSFIQTGYEYYMDV